MKTTLHLATVTVWLGLALSADAAEPFRPLYHFTPEKNWMNDPNGMVFHDGEWHLFYQYNPFGDTWGHMSWGHAVSRDLLRWEHLPVALAEENGVMIFSGSAVMDEKNTSGFGKDGKPPMVAIYTAHTGTNQSQAIAFSTDRGRTFTKYAGNPVLDIGAKDFRDPKVIWHALTKRWIMSVTWPVERKVRFYASPNLKAWTHLSDFGPAGSVAGIWECPDLFPLKIEGGGEKWVLIVNVGSGGPAGGSAGQYFVGEFDGSSFRLDDAPARPATDPAIWLDHGPDFYAGVTWSGGPPGDDRRILLGWMSNWPYANAVTTSPWRGAMSVPREVSLRRDGASYRLVQKPVREMAAMRAREVRFPGGTVAEANDWLNREGVTGDAMELIVTLTPSPSNEAALEVLADETYATAITANAAVGTLRVNRSRSGRTDFHPDFSGEAVAPLPAPPDGVITLRVLIDACSVEVFAADGATALTSLVFPTPTARAVRVTAATSVRSIVARMLAPLK